VCVCVRLCSSLCVWLGVCVFLSVVGCDLSVSVCVLWQPSCVCDCECVSVCVRLRWCLCVYLCVTVFVCGYGFVCVCVWVCVSMWVFSRLCLCVYWVAWLARYVFGCVSKCVANCFACVCLPVFLFVRICDWLLVVGVRACMCLYGSLQCVRVCCRVHLLHTDVSDQFCVCTIPLCIA